MAALSFCTKHKNEHSYVMTAVCDRCAALWSISCVHCPTVPSLQQAEIAPAASVYHMENNCCPAIHQMSSRWRDTLTKGSRIHWLTDDINYIPVYLISYLNFSVNHVNYFVYLLLFFFFNK